MRPTQRRTAAKLFRPHPEELAHITARPPSGRCRKHDSTGRRNPCSTPLARIDSTLEHLARLAQEGHSPALAERVAAALDDPRALVEHLVHDPSAAGATALLVIATMSSDRRFAALARYLQHGRSGQETERAARIAARHLGTDGPQLAAALMQARADQNLRVEVPVYHLTINCDPTDPIPPAQMQAVADRILADLGIAYPDREPLEQTRLHRARSSPSPARERVQGGPQRFDAALTRVYRDPVVARERFARTRAELGVEWASTLLEAEPERFGVLKRVERPRAFGPQPRAQGAD